MTIIKNIALNILNAVAIVRNGLWAIWMYHTSDCKPQTINYGKEKHQKLDLYIPKDTNNIRKPIIIYAHGGGWIVGSRKNIPPAIWTQLEQGYIVASISYCLLPKSKFPGPINDLIKAHKWLDERADELSIDRDHMIGWGLSAGAQIVNYTALKYQIFSAVISWYGFSDLEIDDPSYFHPITRRLIASYVDDHRVNATEFINRDSPSFYIVHGARDSYVPHNQSERLYQALKQSDYPSRLRVYPNYFHGDWRINHKHSLNEINTFLDRVTTDIKRL